MLEQAPQLDPQTLLLHLEGIHPGQEWYRRKRTLQRRVEQWRALQGHTKEVMLAKNSARAAHHWLGINNDVDQLCMGNDCQPESVAGSGEGVPDWPAFPRR